MYEDIIRKLTEYKSVRIPLDILSRFVIRPTDYAELCEVVQYLLDNDVLTPVKASGFNGRDPGLYRKYNIESNRQGEKKSYDEEISHLYPSIKGWYAKNPAEYRRDRGIVLPLSEFLLKSYFLLDDRIGCNERALQIWGDEKFLKGKNVDRRERVKSILRKCGLKEDLLNYRNTPELFMPFIAATERGRGKALIVENNSFWYALQDASSVCDIGYEAVIFGRGNNVSAKHSFDEYFESYFCDTFSIQIEECGYVGDIDPVGINILEKIQEANDIRINPDSSLYRLMIEESRKFPDIPITTKQGKSCNISLLQLSSDEEAFVKELFDKDCRIPQEVITHTVLETFFTQWLC